MNPSSKEELNSFFKSNKPKLALFDVDGTIMNSKHELSAATISAINDLQAAGVTCGLATGRSAAGAYPVIDKLGVTGPSMVFAGAYICDSQTKEELFSVSLLQDQINQLVNLCRDSEHYLELYSVDSIYAEKWAELTAIHMEYQYEEPTYDEGWSIASRDSILKAVIAVWGEEATQSVLEWESMIPKIAFSPAPGAAHPGLMFINLTHSDASRAVAFDQFLNLTGLAASEVMCFGDAVADLTFIQKAGCGIAMENAPEQVKSSARFVAPHVDQEGVSFVISALLDSLD